jgi:hypothetical protein
MRTVDRESVTQKSYTNVTQNCVTPNNLDSPVFSRNVVDGAGFGPAASAMPTLRSYQTDLPAQLKGHTHTKNRQKAFKHYLSPQTNIEEVVNVHAEQTTTSEKEACFGIITCSKRELITSEAEPASAALQPT